MVSTLDDRLCGLGGDEKTELTLTACNETQFTCSDGTCTDLFNRLQTIPFYVLILFILCLTQVKWYFVAKIVLVIEKFF